MNQLNELKATPVATLPDYWERAAAMPYTRVELLEPHETPMRQLSAVERATVRVVATPLLDLPAGHSLIHEAAIRLAIFDARGLLRYFSGQHVASALQSVFWPAHPSRYAYRGWELLRATDAADLAEVWLSTLRGSPSDFQYRRARLRDLDIGQERYGMN